MFSIDQYLEVVPIPVLLAAPVLAGLVFLFCPASLRLPAALLVLPPFLVIGRLPLLGAVALGAKALGFAMLLAVAAAAILTPGAKRRLHPITWAYLPLAVIGPAFIITTEENLFPLLRSVQWICMVIAALAVVRTIVDRDSLLRVLKPLAWGLVLATPVLLSALLLGQWTFTGHSRFEPYGASSVQMGVVFTMTVGLSVYFGLRDRIVPLRVVWLGTAAAAFGMGLLSGSRSALITMVVVSAPAGLFLLRKPLLSVPIGLVFLVGVSVVISRVDSNPFSRFSTLETARVTQAQDYIRESIAARPLVGLMGTRGLQADVDESLGFHAHNAYLKMAYTGGVVLATPYVLLAALTLLAAFYVWQNRRLFDVDPMLMDTLAAFMAMVYAHGMVNDMIYKATNTWGFLHVLLSVLFLTWAGDTLRFRRENPALAGELIRLRRLSIA